MYVRDIWYKASHHIIMDPPSPYTCSYVDNVQHLRKEVAGSILGSANIFSEGCW